MIWASFYSADQAHYVGYPDSPCSFEDDISFLLGVSELGSNSFEMMELDTWNDATQTQEVVNASSVSNPSMASLNGSLVTLNSSLSPCQIIEENLEFTEEETLSNCDVIAVTFTFPIEFEIADLECEELRYKAGVDDTVLAIR